MVRRTGVKNIGFISTRIAGTDGVSLEIEKWATVLERNGFNCFYFAGEIDRDLDKSFKVEEAHFEHPFIKRINDSLFSELRRRPEVSSLIHDIKEDLKSSLYEFYNRFNIDLVITENALSIPMNIPLGLALTEFIAETGVKTIAHHHDFYWERKRFFINSCYDYLRMAFPPDLPSVKHVVINSIASKELSYRLGISNVVIPNVYNFAEENQVSLEKDIELKKFIGLDEDGILVLQPTRIVPRKKIERSIEIVQNLKDFKPILVVSHASGDEGDSYSRHIIEYAKRMNVKIVMLGQLIGSNQSSKKKFTLADVYNSADLVTYPSDVEGFGNAFLEAIYYKKPIVVNRYAVYVIDIEPRGFDVISFDDMVTSDVVERIKKVLTDSGYQEAMVNHNFRVAKEFFSYEVLEKKLLSIIETF